MLNMLKISVVHGCTAELNFIKSLASDDALILNSDTIF